MPRKLYDTSVYVCVAKGGNMPRKPQTGKKSNGTGSICKIEKKKQGKTYTYWEGRYTQGYDPGTGKQIQKYVTGKTQKEVAQKLRQLTTELDQGTYIAPSKITLGEWLDIWADTYLVGIKPRTAKIYKDEIRLHMKPALGAVHLCDLTTPMIQNFYNDLFRGSKGKKGLSAKTVKNIHGTLHHALKQALLVGYLRFNPSDACILPRQVKRELKPLDENDISAFLQAIRGHRFEDIFAVTLFTGLREGEVLGLTWDCIDFASALITVSKQMQLHQEGNDDAYELVSTKNDRRRTVPLAPTVLNILKSRKLVQEQQQLLAGEAWSNPQKLVFTDSLGKHLTKPTVYRSFKKVVAAIGRPDARFHDLRHSYAVAAIRSGDDIKTVQSNLGHATAAFTLDVYGHVTDRMKQESAARMEAFIQMVSGR